MMNGTIYSKHVPTNTNCMVSNIKPYKGGIIDTYEGVSFEVKPLGLVTDRKAIVPAHIEGEELF